MIVLCLSGPCDGARVQWPTNPDGRPFTEARIPITYLPTITVRQEDLAPSIRKVEDHSCVYYLHYVTRDDDGGYWLATPNKDTTIDDVWEQLLVGYRKRRVLT